MNSYTILGVTEGDDDAKIRKAQLRLAVRYHPDKGGDPAKFQEITDAQHDILEARLRSQERERSMKEIFEETFREVNAAFERSSGGRRVGAVPSQPVERKARMTLQELWDGGNRKVVTKQRADCVDCDGMGRLGSRGCGECDGTGVKDLQVRLGGGLVVSNRRDCKECSGRGRVPDTERAICSVCRGTGKQGRQLPIPVQIPPLSRPGDAILVHNEGVGLPSQGVLFRIQLDVPVGVKSCEIRGLDLVIGRVVSVRDALCGFSWGFAHPSGEFTELRVRPVSPGEEIRVRGKGWADADGNRGDLVLQFTLEWPEKTEVGFREELGGLWDRWMGSSS